MQQQKPHKDLVEFLRNNPSATRQEILRFGDGLTKQLIGRCDFESARATQDALLEALNADSAASRRALEESLEMTHAASRRAAAAARGAAPHFSLPQGITAGKVTAMVAGVGLLVAGAYALFQSRADEPSLRNSQVSATSWVNRIERQRFHEKARLQPFGHHSL